MASVDAMAMACIYFIQLHFSSKQIIRLFLVDDYNFEILQRISILIQRHTTWRHMKNFRTVIITY